MKRLAVGIVATILTVGLLASGADAQKKKKRGKPKAEAAPTSAAISPALGKLKWGMSKDDVLKLLVQKIRKTYRPRIAKTQDAMEEDRLRSEMLNKISRIRESFIRFDGQSTGWDIGFLRDEFTHNNDEAMLVTKDANSQNFYFFIGNRLWKLYKAFDIGVFEGKDFSQFAGAVHRKFGPSKEKEGELVPGSGKRRWLEWQDDATRLRAVDQTSFYGFYCLVFEHKDTVEKLTSLRSNAPRRGKSSHALVDAVTSDSDMSANPDKAPDIVDRITGKLRVRNDSAE